jgi:hypothetical protein
LRRYIYAACPDGSQPIGPKDLDQGIIVLDIDAGCKYVKTLTTPAFAEAVHGAAGGRGVRGLCGHTATKRLYYTFKGHPMGVAIVGCIDLETEKLVWEFDLAKDDKARDHRVGAGQPAITPDGKKLYVPPEWGVGVETTVLNAEDGRILAFVNTGGNGCGNAVMSPDGKHVYASAHATRIDTATDQIAWGAPSGKSPRGPAARHSHYMMDATGGRIFGTYEVSIGIAAVVYAADTGEILDRLSPPDSGPLAFFRACGLGHEASFTPSGDRLWIQAMEFKNPEPPADLLSHPHVVDTGGRGPIKWVTEWDVSKIPAVLLKAVATRSPGHSHAHALVTREGDLVLTGNGYALDVATGRLKATWQDKQGRWFQCTKFAQVNVRDGKIDWVGQRHGTGWLYRTPSLSESRPALLEQAPTR